MEVQGFRDRGFELEVRGFVFRGSEFLRFQVRGSGFSRLGVSGLAIRGLGFQVRSFEVRGFEIWCFGFGVRGLRLGFMV